MNKIVLKNNQLMLSEIDFTISLCSKEKTEFKPFQLEIKVVKDTSLLIEYQNEIPSKYDIQIIVEPNCSFELYEKKKEQETKIQYRYDISEQASVTVHKFQEAKKIKELDIVYLQGYESQIDYDLKAISFDKQKYDMVIYHCQSNSKSNISNRLLALQAGEIHINVTSIVYPQMKDTNVIQNNRILNLNNKKHTICPNLLIEQNDIDASHSAHIGSFDPATLFYMKSRGMSEKEATKLLLKGFLQMDFIPSEELEKIIDQYWR